MGWPVAVLIYVCSPLILFVWLLIAAWLRERLRFEREVDGYIGSAQR
jgi:hypothetical protein